MRNLDPSLLGHIRFTVDHPALDLHSGAHSIDHTRKFRQHSIAGILNDPAPMLLDLRIDQVPKVRPEPFVRPFLVIAHETRITDHISGEDRSETARRGHG